MIEGAHGLRSPGDDLLDLFDGGAIVAPALHTQLAKVRKIGDRAQITIHEFCL